MVMGLLAKRIFFVVLVMTEVVLRIFFRSRGVGVENLGVSFGLWQGVGVWMIGLLLILVIWKLDGWSKWMIGVGGFINLVDRLVYGSVWDYIYWPWLGLWNNGADLMIFVGAIIVVWKLFGRTKI